MTDPDRTVAVVAIVASIAVLVWVAALRFDRWATRRVAAMVDAALDPVAVAQEYHDNPDRIDYAREVAQLRADVKQFEVTGRMR